MDLEHGSGSSQHSEIYPEVINWSGSSSDHHFETYPKNRVRAPSSDHLILHPEIIDGNESSKLSETHPEVTDEIFSSEHSASQPDATAYEGDQVMPTVNLDSSDSFSLSSSSTSSLGDPIHVSKIESFNPRAYSTHFDKPNEDIQPASEHREASVPDNPPISEEFKNGSPGHIPRAPVSGITNESPMHRMSPTDLPPVQVMERSSGYDPFRIPPSVFEKPTTPVDWSIASNESLFSIHGGNNSFSRDHVFLMGDLCKSGELTKSDELIMFSPPPPIAVVGIHNQSSVPVLETNEQAFETEKAKITRVVDNTIEDASKEVTEDESEKDRPAAAVSWKSSSKSKHYDGSGDSKHSFSFPVRKKKCCAWPLCHCSNCSWAFCYCWNCSKKGLCCHSSSTLTDSLKSGSLKATVEEQHLQEQPTATVSCFHWFHCFSCFRCSCSCLPNPCRSCPGCFSC